ncbi:SPOR domain-containing protein [Treponema bryantii]|uniref:SPOR domain-containing protein n=1 Tax=Treponema bryantii TaxID=163 RepID=UPI0003B4A410|nr:SPOR domain-containing protein [Treponema bryantii]
MKNKIKSFFKILVVTAGCLMFASFSPSLDGRAVVVDEGVFPQGLFAKTVGYLPGDIISVTNIAGDSTIDLLVIGALDPSEGVAIMLSPEAADAMGLDRGANNIVKITKRSGQDERVYGNAVISKSSAEIEDWDDDEYDSIGAEENSDAFEEPEAEAEEADAEEAGEAAEESEESSEEDFEEPAVDEEEAFDETEEEAFEEEAEDTEESEEIPAEEEAPVEEETVEEEALDEEALPEEEFADEEETFEEEAVAEEELPEEEAPAEEAAEEETEEEFEEPEESEEEPAEEEAFDSEELDELPEEAAEEALEEEAPAEESEEEETEEDIPEEETLDEEAFEEEEPDQLPAEEEAAEEETEEAPAEEAFDEDELDALPEETETPAEESVEETESEEYEAIVLVPADSNPPENEDDEVEDVVAEDELENIDETITLTPLESSINKSVSSVTPVSPAETKSAAVAEAETSYDKYLVPSLNQLESGKYYVQIAAYGSDANILEIINKYGSNYPITIVPMANGKTKQVLVGPVTMDEYKVVLERFKSYGFKDAFLRKVK